MLKGVAVVVCAWVLSVALHADFIETSDGRRIELGEIPTERGGQFRFACWGQYPFEVKESEPWRLLSENDDVLEYQGNFKQYQAIARYRFHWGRLGAAEYQIDLQHDDARLYLNDYENILGMITQIYGEPISVEDDWLTDWSRNNYVDQGLAVLEGALEKSARWNTPATQIELMIKQIDSQVVTLVNYQSKSHQVMADSFRNN